MNCLKKILLCLITVFVAIDVNAMALPYTQPFTLKNIHTYCSTHLCLLVTRDTISTHQACNYFKRFQNEVFYEPLAEEIIHPTSHKKELKKCFMVQDIITKKLTDALHVKQKTTMIVLVYNIVCEIFGDYPLSDRTKKLITTAIGSSADKPLLLTIKNYSSVIWYVTGAIINLYIDAWYGSDFFLKKFSDETNKDDYATSSETKFVLDVLKNPRIKTLMRDDVMMCSLFDIDKKELEEMVKTLMLMIKMSLPSGRCKEGDNGLADITSRFDVLKITSQSMLDSVLDSASQAFKNDNTIAPFYLMLLHCLWEYYKKQ